MTIYLKQSTAGQEIPLGYFVDSTDGNTEETALTINNTDIKLWKTGATTLASKNSGGGTHISNGVYYATLDATDTNTLGSMVIFIHVTGSLSVKLDCMVLAANVYDSLIGGGDTLDVNTTTFLGETTLNAVVDAIFKRDLSAITGEAARSLLNAVRKLRNKWTISGSTLTVYKEDDTTSAFTEALTTAAGADSITASDPT